MLQNRNSMQPAERSADMVFTIRAISDGSLANEAIGKYLEAVAAVERYAVRRHGVVVRRMLYLEHDGASDSFFEY